MKHLLRLLVAGLLLGAAACSKNDSAPYYQFTAEDRQWLTARDGDTWVFENPAGRRMRFQVYRVLESKETAVAPRFLRTEETHQYDRFSYSIARLDTSANIRGSMQFERNLPSGSDSKKPPKGEGTFFIEGFWDGYLGNPTATSQNRLNFPPADERSRRFQPLTVRGQAYARVLLLQADGQCANCFIPGGIAYDKIYYDQQAGIVRMVTPTGVVWDRVP